MSTVTGLKPDMDMNLLAGIAIVGGLICIIAAVVLNAIAGVNYFAFLGAVGAILATIWGADAVRKICKYGIGTGVPSIGMLAFGMGLLATLLGLKLGDYIAANFFTMDLFGMKAAVLVGPVLALIIALIQGAIIGFIANSILKMKIPTMQVGMTYIAGAAALIVIGYSVVLTGKFDYSTMVNDVFLTGFIAPIFMIGALPMLHPFNACLGPDEYQRRTLTLAVESALMTTIMFGIMSFYKLDAVSAVITIGLGLIAWLIAYLAYWGKVKESGTTILKTGLIPKKEA